MTDSFLESAGGYTPVPDKLVREYDYTTAYVWGKVWRYCQMENGKCTASHETIAKRAGMSRRTLINKLDQLIQGGYVEDLTPDLKNKPHTYCTKKGEEKIKSTVQNLHSELDESANITQPEEPTVQDLPTDYADFAQSGESTMQNLHLKKEESFNPIESNGLPNSSPNGEEADKPPPSVEPENNQPENEEPEKPPPKIEYTPFLRTFLAYFNARRFKNFTQANTVSDLTEKYGETEVTSLAEWAAKKGMGLGQAIPAIESALKKPRKNQNGAINGQGSKHSGPLRRTGEGLDQQPTFDPYSGEVVVP